MGTTVLNFLNDRFLANQYAKMFDLIKETNYFKLSNELNRLKSKSFKLINFQNREGVTLLMLAVYIGLVLFIYFIILNNL